MTKYEIIFESLQEKVNTGELTLEDAEILNDVAYEKYAEDETEYEEAGMTYEEYLESMEEEMFGEATRLAKEIQKKRMSDDVDVRSDALKHDSISSGKIFADAKNRRREWQNELDEWEGLKKASKKDSRKLARKSFVAITPEKRAELRSQRNANKKDLSDINDITSNLRKRVDAETYLMDGSKDVGDENKKRQQEKYDTLPSKKTLEKKPSGSVLKIQKTKNGTKKKALMYDYINKNYENK